MLTRRTALGLFATALLPARLKAADREPDYLRKRIDAGELPPAAERLPKVPRVMDVTEFGGLPGRHGGTIRTIVSSQKDIRLMTLYGNTRLVGYDRNLAFVADVLESFDVVEGRIFTFKLRDGHRWSDGAPLTAEDFRYCWEDVLNNEDLSSGGLSVSLLVGGEKPLFEIVDPLTVRYTWKAPNPDFLPNLAAPQPLTLALPAHYLKQFHKKYQDEDKLAKLMKKNKAKKWTGLHIKMSRTYRPENPELPMLDPWCNRTPLPAEQFVFERNPFFHRTDQNGLQLPYIDKVVLSVSSSSIVPAKTGAGESDLQAHGIDFNDYTFLKDSEKRYPVKVTLWKKTQGSRFSILPNLNYDDQVWSNILRDVRFRRALSVAINRHEINMASFFGLATPSADTVLPQSPLFRPEFANAWIDYNPDLANRLLDEAGLAQRDDDGIRVLPDGRPAQLIVETAGESTLETDVLELVSDHWMQVGLAMFIRTSQRDIFRSRALAGKVMLSLWQGLDNGVPTADMSPAQLAPTAEYAYQWPLWGVHYVSHGAQGTAPDLPEVVELMRLLGEWQRSASMADRTRVWDRMLSIYTDQVFSIGTVNQSLQPILRSARLHNLPEDGIYGFDPTSYLGFYNPDTFWLEDA
ncbi:ABC transporter substrate-binding protein [Kumtagia ephedrae]|uniref:Peptide ABC transporter substrate-binding protein n=1 Tax=Kumtagia ephedrae TaxID=2116701 RepID=A0A2P7S3H2_9HYPH|nr:ABC transporter substrate-binding protein [Mesorhizobium ephedrae]PSJ56979.1 peptide ABC transporter substrate-binding protein [Mesorhizobium ephedrae]